MPNWCFNILAVSGSPNLLGRFKRVGLEPTGEKADGFFSRFSKCPEGEDWYEWDCANWGTKWDVEVAEINLYHDKEGSIKLSFDTAWSPPLEAVMTMSRAFPELEFVLYWEEPGMNFEGRAIIGNGQQIDIIEREITSSAFVEDDDGDLVENDNIISLEERF